MSENERPRPQGPAWRFLDGSTSVVALLVDSEGIIRHANGHAEALIGETLVDRPWHTLSVNFGGPLELAAWLAQTARPRLLNVRTALRLPQTLKVTVEPWGEYLLMIGEVDATEQNQMRRELLELNQELSNLTRELALRNDELIRAQSQLLQADRLASIGTLAASVAHEIINPVSFVSANLGSLGEHVESLLRYIDAIDAVLASSADRAPQADALAALKSELELPCIRDEVPALLAQSREGLDRVGRIVTVLLGFARLDAMQDGCRLEDLHQGLEGTLVIAHAHFGPRCELRREFGELPAVECQLPLLNQVFMNLLVNAAQAAGADGHVTVRTGCTGPQAWVEVEDSGPGIAPADLDRLFDPFFTTKPPGQGTGLGLSIAHHIVQQHHGRIDVASPPGQGARFRVWLPVVQPTAPRTTPALRSR